MKHRLNANAIALPFSLVEALKDEYPMNHLKRQLPVKLL
jgi:hypothetical protein